MIVTALYLALGCAVISAIAKSRTAWVLVPAVAFCLWMAAEGVEFRRAFWVTIDLTAVFLIYGVNIKMRLADWAILALFPVAWAFYFLPDPYRYTGTMLVTIVQLLLTFPALRVFRRFVSRWKANFRHRDEWTDLRVRGTNV